MHTFNFTHTHTHIHTHTHTHTHGYVHKGITGYDYNFSTRFTTFWQRGLDPKNSFSFPEKCLTLKGTKKKYNKCAHMHPALSAIRFPKVWIWNSSNAGLNNDGPFWSLRGRTLRSFPCHTSLLHAVGWCDVLTLVPAGSVWSSLTLQIFWDTATNVT